MARTTPFPEFDHRHCVCADCSTNRAKAEQDASSHRAHLLLHRKNDAEFDQLMAESKARVEKFEANLKAKPKPVHPLLRPYPCVRNGKQVRMGDDLNIVGTYNL